MASYDRDKPRTCTIGNSCRLRKKDKTKKSLVWQISMGGPSSADEHVWGTTRLYRRFIYVILRSSGEQMPTSAKDGQYDPDMGGDWCERIKSRWSGPRGCEALEFPWQIRTMGVPGIS